MKRTIHVVPHQHFDIIWRRDVEWYRNKRFELIIQALDLLKENADFTFTFSQAYVIREFIENNLCYKGDIKQLLKEKRLEIVGGVETVGDLNMSSGPAILKNIEMGKEWFLANLDYDVCVGGFEDAFGITAQLPQLLALAGYRFYKAGRMPRAGASDVCGNFWLKGLDQTQVRCISPKAGFCDWGWGFSDNPDDPVVPSMAERYKNVYHSLLAAADTSEENSLFVVMGEEHDILEDIVNILPELSKETGCNYTFSTFERYYDTISDADWEGLPVIDCVSTDLSRIFTGCYTTRRKSKVEPRELESKLLFADGANTQCWRDLFVLQFHDAICGCHIDENASYLRRLYVEAQKRLECVDVKLPWEETIPNFVPGADKEILKSVGHLEINNYQIDIQEDQLINVIWNGTDYSTLCQIMLREDSGTLWTEEYSGCYFEAPKRDAIVSVSQTGELLNIVTEGCAPGFREMWPGFSQLKWQKSLTFHKHSSLVLIELELDWLGNSTEIALAWNGQEIDDCVAEIPFGSKKRGVYKSTADTIWGEAFPALNWVKTENFVVFNRATPGHAIRNGHVESILLRSPVKRWSPWFPVTPSEQCWDNGRQTFSFLWQPVDAGVDYASLHRMGMEFNVNKNCHTSCIKTFENIPENIVISSMIEQENCIEIIAFEANGDQAVWTEDKYNIKESFQPSEIKRISVKR